MVESALINGGKKRLVSRLTRSLPSPTPNLSINPMQSPMSQNNPSFFLGWGGVIRWFHIRRSVRVRSRWPRAESIHVPLPFRDGANMSAIVLHGVVARSDKKPLFTGTGQLNCVVPCVGALSLVQNDVIKREDQPNRRFECLEIISILIKPGSFFLLKMVYSKTGGHY